MGQQGQTSQYGREIEMRNGVPRVMVSKPLFGFWQALCALSVSYTHLLEAVPVRDTSPVTAKRMGLLFVFGQAAGKGLPNSLHDVGSKCEHGVSISRWVRVATGSCPDRPDDWWILIHHLLFPPSNHDMKR